MEFPVHLSSALLASRIGPFRRPFGQRTRVQMPGAFSSQELARNNTQRQVVFVTTIAVAGLGGDVRFSKNADLSNPLRVIGGITVSVDLWPGEALYAGSAGNGVVAVYRETY